MCENMDYRSTEQGRLQTLSTHGNSVKASQGQTSSEANGAESKKKKIKDTV